MRFSIRKMMLIVAVLGVVAWGFSLARRREAFLDQAEAHKLSADVLFGALERADADEKAGIHRPAEIFPSAQHLRNLVHHHDMMHEKWARAACHPWLSVEPDPPAPLLRDATQGAAEYYPHLPVEPDPTAP